MAAADPEPPPPTADGAVSAGAVEERPEASIEDEPILQVDHHCQLYWSSSSSGGAVSSASRRSGREVRSPGETHEDIAAWLEALYARQRECLAKHPPPQGSKVFSSSEPGSRRPAWHALLEPEPAKPSLWVRVPRAACSDWGQLEAALFVHSLGQFHPLRERRADPDGFGALPSVISDDGTADTSRISVSVICPTTSERQAYHPLIYECFRRQSHELRELVVIDTGTQPSRFFQERAAEDPRVVYRFFESAPKAWPCGLKRNIACYLAKGHVVAHFDDDDLYAPGYLAFMLARLVGAKLRVLWKSGVPAAVAKLSAWHILDAETRTWGFLDAKGDPEVEEMRHSWLYGWGFSYVYTRTAWEQEPFPEVTFAEDYAWISKILDKKIPVALARDQRMQSEGVACHTYHPSTSTSGGEFREDTRCGFLVQQAPPALADLVPTFDSIIPSLPGKQPANRYEAMLRQDFADRVGLREKTRRGGRLIRYRWERFSSHLRW